MWQPRCNKIWAAAPKCYNQRVLPLSSLMFHAYTANDMEPECVQDKSENPEHGPNMAPGSWCPDGLCVKGQVSKGLVTLPPSMLESTGRSSNIHLCQWILGIADADTAVCHWCVRNSQCVTVSATSTEQKKLRQWKRIKISLKKNQKEKLKRGKGKGKRERNIKQ